MKTFYIAPHTHFDAEVFLTREEYLSWGYTNIIEVLNMMHLYPEYRFVLDQACYIKPFMESFPELIAEFKQYIAEGRLDIVGGMYAMSDVNIPSGESLVRQFLVGMDFFKNTLGVDVKVGWTIDTFGHHPQLAQIMHKAGLRYDVFGRVAALAQSEFRWQALDGSEIICHWMPYHYGTMINLPTFVSGYSKIVENRFNALAHYATGDELLCMEGGDLTPPNRPTPDLVKAYNEQSRGLFELKIATPSEFFAAVEKRRDSLPVSTDDFNPVFQGCYSARIDIKQQNRRAEGLLYTAEFLDALVRVNGDSAPPAELRDAWELVLFNQFHDDICGVVVDKVHALICERYTQAMHACELIISDRLGRLAAQVDTTGAGVPVLVVNTLGWARTDVVRADVGYTDMCFYGVCVTDADGCALPAQLESIERYPNGSIKRATVVFAATVGAFGYSVCHIAGSVDCFMDDLFEKDMCWANTNDIGILENDAYRLSFDQWNGAVTSVVDKHTGTEYADPQRPWLNSLWHERDIGDFWEINSPLRGGITSPYNRGLPLSEMACLHSTLEGGSAIKGIGKGPVQSFVAFEQKTADYSIETRITLTQHSRRIDFRTKITNKTKNSRYRAAFPLDIRGGTATYEIPFGSLERPEGEYPAQNWMDYADDNKGVGLINCGLPGNAVFEDTMLLSLMKCTSYVGYGDAGGFSMDEAADGGHEIGVPHVFDYALYPHDGDWQSAGLHQAAAEKNNPLLVRKCAAESGKLPCAYSLFEISQPAVTASCVKSDGDSLILRVCEMFGTDCASVQIRFAAPLASVVATDLLENALSDVIECDSANAFTFSIGHNEIKTFRVILAAQ